MLKVIEKPVICFFYKKLQKPEYIKKAFKYYNLALKQEDPISAYRLGFIYFSGMKPYEKDEVKAYNFLNISASKGYAPAFGILGVLYATSSKIDRDLDKAKDYLVKGVESKDAYSAIMLDNFCRNKIINCGEKEKSLLEENYFKKIKLKNR